MTATALLDRRLAADLRPPRRARPFGGFARTLRLPDGSSAGNTWVPETEPTQSAFVAHVDSGRWQIYVVVAPSQRGKTLKAILSPTLWRITECRQSVAYVLPSLDKLTQNWEGKIRPAIEGTGFGDWLPQKGPGSKGGRPAVLTLRDPDSGLIANRWYFMAMGKGGNETSVSSVSPQHIAIDEGDDAVSAGQLKNTCKRIESWGREGSAYIASTVNDRTGRESPDPTDPDAAHPILVFYKSGSRHRQHHRCPHCTAYFAPVYEDINLEQAIAAMAEAEVCALAARTAAEQASAAEEALAEAEVLAYARATSAAAAEKAAKMATEAKAAQTIVCRKCGVIWSEADRKDALNRSLSVGSADRIVNGHVMPGEYSHRIYSELTTGLDYHMGDLSAIIADIKAAKSSELRGDYSLMKTVMHKIFCRPYVEPELEGELNSETLAKFSSHSTSSKRLVPLWAEFLVITQDVQGDRHYWETVAHGPDERWAIIDWGYEFLVPKNTDGNERAPTKADRIRVLDAIRDIAEQGWQIEGGEGRMRPVQSGVDCGYLAEEVSAWVQGNPSWKAVRGVGFDELKDTGGGIEKTLPPEIRATKALRAVKPPGWRIYWWKVDGHVFRRSAHAALLRSPDQPGSGILPQGLKANSDLILHLTGEIWTEPEEGKTGKPFWREVRKRHDYLDCLVYNLALALLHRYAPDRRDSGDPAPVPAVPASGDNSWIESSFDQSPGGWING